jgi:hypothetical protein
MDRGFGIVDAATLRRILLTPSPHLRLLFIRELPLRIALIHAINDGFGFFADIEGSLAL